MLAKSIPWIIAVILLIACGISVQQCMRLEARTQAADTTHAARLAVLSDQCERRLRAARLECIMSEHVESRADELTSASDGELLESLRRCLDE